MSEQEFQLNHRYLVKPYGMDWIESLTEVKVLEISPTGKHIKFLFAGGPNWCESDKYVIVENLDSQPSHTDAVAKTFQSFAAKHGQELASYIGEKHD